MMTSALRRLARLANATSLGVKSGSTSRADTSILRRLLGRTPGQLPTKRPGNLTECQ